MEKGDRVYYFFLNLGGDTRIYRAEYIKENPGPQKGLNMHLIRIKERVYDNMMGDPHRPEIGKTYLVGGDFLWPSSKVDENIEKYKSILFRMIFSVARKN